MSPPPAVAVVAAIAIRQLQALAQPVHMSRGLEADQVRLSRIWEVQRIGVCQAQRVQDVHVLGLHRDCLAVQTQPVLDLEVRHCHDADI